MVNQIIDTLRSMDPEDMFQNSLMESDTIFDTKPIISKKPINNEMIISPILAQMLFHSMSHLPLIGIYSCNVFHKPKCLHWIKMVAQTAMSANARLNSNSAVGLVTNLNHCGIMNLIMSFIIQIILDRKITRNKCVTNFVIRNSVFSPSKSSKNSRIP
jgi:hypothetical protein